MTKQMSQIAVKKTEVTEMQMELAGKIASHIQAAGQNETAVRGLTLFRNTAPTTCNLVSVEPSVTFFAQGKKRINIGGTDYPCDASSFLVASVDLPVQSQIVEASEAVPQLAMRLRLDMQTVREVVSREDMAAPEGSRCQTRNRCGAGDGGIAGRRDATYRSARHSRGHSVSFGI